MQGSVALYTIHMSHIFSGGGFARSSLSLGSAGTRRTVYYTEEETNEEEQPKVVVFLHILL